MTLSRADLVRSVVPVKRTREQYRSGGKATFLKWWRESLLYGLIQGKAGWGEAVFVEQAEGDLRALICVGC